MHIWKKLVGGCLVAGMLALLGCGGSGGSGGGTEGGELQGNLIAATSTKFTAAMVTGKTYDFDLVMSNGSHINPMSITFNSDGTGAGRGAASGAVTWNIDNSGRLIIVNPSIGLNISVAITDDSNPSVIKTKLYEYNTSNTINTLVTATMTLSSGTPA